MTASPPAVTRERWQVLCRLLGSAEARIERALRTGHGVSAREFALLDVLSRRHHDDGRPSTRDLAHAIGLSHSATTRLMIRLEDRGLIRRSPCTADARRIRTRASDTGLALARQARHTHRAALREALAEAAGDPHLAPVVRAVRDELERRVATR
ncbi:MarR family transcriptional regulator [Streptomyces sp. NPDC046727]|uniref:MarR family winged helix-turn-helix transcriptional regulator n=1 Tax=Streptomyces sp. NPDC046727 TaxID=3155373 RepID=UPI0033D94B49